MKADGAVLSGVYMQLFNCCSARLNRALIDNGFSPIYITCVSETLVWVYELSEELINYKNNKYQLERDKY